MRARRNLLFALAAVLLLLAAIVRVQPSDTATIYRSGDRVFVRRGVVFVRPLTVGRSCTTRTLGDSVLAQLPVRVVTKTRDEITLNVTAAYDVPATAPRDWPDGDWCTSLNARISAVAATWARANAADVILNDVRVAQHDAGDAITSRLGVRTRQVNVAFALPHGFDRLRANASIAGASKAARPVIFIGLDGADWELLDDFMSAGQMPVLQRLVREGAGGVLMTEHPPLSPLLWTTMMTGVGPLDHQILDFTRFSPYTRVLEPITSDERRAPAIWNMMSAAGKSVAVFGIWATYAAEPVHGVNVSDRLFTFLFSEKGLPPRAVYPDERMTWARDALASAEQSVSLARMREYLPQMTEAELSEAARATNPYAQPASALRRILIETEVYRRLALDYLKTKPLPDLTIAYLQGTDTVGHVFAPFAPPRQPQVRPEDFERFSEVPARYFREIDGVLAAFVRVAEENGAVVVIASDHGFRWKEGRPVELSSFAAASAAKWHRNEGMFVMWGPGVAAQPGHPLRGGVRQICATLASLAGIPAPDGAEANPLGGVAKPAAAKYPFQVAEAPPAPGAGADASEDIAKLRALGYIGSAEPSRSTAAGDTKTAGALNNAGLIQRQDKSVAAAIDSFQKALSIDPNYASAEWNLSDTLFQMNQQTDRSDELLIRSLGHGLPEGVRHVVERSIQYRRTSRADRAQRLLDAAVAARPAEAELRLFRGRSLLEAKNCPAALEDFTVASRERPDAVAFASLALAQMCMGDEAGARANMSKAQALSGVRRP